MFLSWSVLPADGPETKISSSLSRVRSPARTPLKVVRCRRTGDGRPALAPTGSSSPLGSRIGAAAKLPSRSENAHNVGIILVHQ